MEDVNPQGEARVDAWAKVQAAFSTVAGWYGGEDIWIMGAEGPCYADLFIAAYLMWIKMVLGEESEEWKDVMAWDGGRWRRHISACEGFDGQV